MILEYINKDRKSYLIPEKGTLIIVDKNYKWMNEPTNIVFVSKFPEAWLIRELNETKCSIYLIAFP